MGYCGQCVKEINHKQEKIVALEKGQEGNQIIIDQLEQYDRQSNLKFHKLQYSRNKDTN